MKTLLIAWHSRTGATAQMVESARAAAATEEEIQVVAKRAELATSADVLAADAVLFAAPENLASLSGAMKEFLDRSRSIGPRLWPNSTSRAA